MVRVFCIAMASRKMRPIKKTSHAQQLQKTRNIMTKAMTAGAVSNGFNGLVEGLKDSTLSRHNDSRCSWIFPLEKVSVGKVRFMKADKIDSLKLLDQQCGTPAV